MVAFNNVRGIDEFADLWRVVRDVSRRIANLVDDTLLDFGLRIVCRFGLREAGQVVNAGYKNVLNATIFQLVQHAEPELR